MKVLAHLNLLFAFSIAQFCHGGFLAGTLVKTLSGYTPIEHLQLGDWVRCCNDQGKFVTGIITYKRSKPVKPSLQLCVMGTRGAACINASPEQLFYKLPEKCWVKAAELLLEDTITAGCTESVTIYDSREITEEAEIYEISVADYHNFCVSKLDVKVHNIVPFIVGATASSAAAVSFLSVVAPVFVPAVILAAGLPLLMDCFSSNKSSNSYSYTYVPCNPGDPNDPCKYEDAGYHHPNSRGRKSSSPKNGQEALDRSIPTDKYGNSPRRIGVSNNQIVMLTRTSKSPRCLYHGHVEEWDDLDDYLQQALKRANLVDKFGKPI